MLTQDMITYLVVHCADTPDEACLNAVDIHEMHLGFGWDGAGYHHIICRDGEVEAGRPRYWQGAHVYGQNENSLGICLIGRSQFTHQQMNSLTRLLHELKCQYPRAEIVGHRDIQDTRKTCPNFDVRTWWRQACLLDGKTACVLPSYTPLYARPPDPDQTASGLDTELLAGEAVVLSDTTTKDGYVYITALTDGYQGWAKLADFGKWPGPEAATAFICHPFCLITAKPDVKSLPLKTLPFGARLVVTGPAEAGFIPVRTLADDGLPLSGYAVENQIFPDTPQHHKDGNGDWTGWAERFIGVPYKWGGRTAAGLDCSALIQLSLAASGFALPRDTGPQFSMLSDFAIQEKKQQTFARGDILFWNGHVAFCIDEEAIIHANAHHHAVTVEPRQQAIERIKQNYGPLLAHIPADAVRQNL